jgi:hypothetical protein
MLRRYRNLACSEARLSGPVAEARARTLLLRAPSILAISKHHLPLDICSPTCGRDPFRRWRRTPRASSENFGQRSSETTRNFRIRLTMADAIMVALVVICFAVTAGYAVMCDRLLNDVDTGIASRQCIAKSQHNYPPSGAVGPQRRQWE